MSGGEDKNSDNDKSGRSGDVVMDEPQSPMHARMRTRQPIVSGDVCYRWVGATWVLRSLDE